MAPPYKALQYDASPELIRAVQEKAAQRAARKAEYVKMMSDPYRWATQTVPVDLGIERFEAQRTFSGNYKFFRPTVKNFLWHIGTIWVPIILTTYLCSRSRAAREHRYRTGQVAYIDRIEKFA